jgi:hypothetical protein
MLTTSFSRMFGICLIGLSCLVLHLPRAWSQNGADQSNAGTSSEAGSSQDDAIPPAGETTPGAGMSATDPGDAAGADAPLDPMRSRFLRDQLRMLRDEERQILFEMQNLRPSDPGANVVRQRMEEDLEFVRQEARRIEQQLGMEPGSTATKENAPQAPGAENSPFSGMSPSSLRRIQGELEFEIQQIDRTLGLLDEDEQDLAETLKKERAELLEELNQVQSRQNQSGDPMTDLPREDMLPGRRTPPRDVPPFPGFENVNPAPRTPRDRGPSQEDFSALFGDQNEIQTRQRQARIRELEDSIRRFRNMGLDSLVETAQKELDQLRREAEADESAQENAEQAVSEDAPARGSSLPPGFSQSPVGDMPPSRRGLPENPPAYGWSGDPWSAGEATSAEIGQLRQNIESLQSEVVRMRDQLSALQSQIQLLNQNLVLSNQQKMNGQGPETSGGGPMENQPAEQP